MKLKNTLTALLAATFAVSPVMADEGMWLLPFSNSKIANS